MFAVANRSRSLFSRTAPKRHAGGWLKKNIYYEENAGLRENSYKTWDPSENGSGWRLLGLLVFPFVVIGYYIVAERDQKSKVMGRSLAYGILPPPAANLHDRDEH